MLFERCGLRVTGGSEWLRAVTCGAAAASCCAPAAGKGSSRSSGSPMPASGRSSGAGAWFVAGAMCSSDLGRPAGTGAALIGAAPGSGGGAAQGSGQLEEGSPGAQPEGTVASVVNTAAVQAASLAAWNQKS